MAQAAQAAQVYTYDLKDPGSYPPRSQAFAAFLKLTLKCCVSTM